MTTGILYYAKGTLRVTKATDEDGKVQQNLLGGHDITTTTYSFSGKPLTVTHAHTATGKTSRTEVYTYTYDEKDRVSTVKHKLGSTEVTLATYTYDTFGRMATRQPHGNATNKLTYTYNIQSWLTGISSTKFTQTLTYNNGTTGFNGNISSMNWTANGTSHAYTFTYDDVNRMLNATHGTGAYTEKVTLYDKNGNIKALQRYGNGLIDNLTYTYNGNQLTKVEDATGNAAGFSNGANAANEYTYDNNGNLTKDSNKNISTIAYNCLNLPSKVTFTDGSTITYSYAADGTKLRTVHTINGTTTTKDYCSNVVYENGIQKMLLTEDGYVDLSASTPVYYYYLKDHQGNNRVVINSSGTVSETNHYYPFGGVFASTGNVQPYKYNGKELDTKKGLNWYDYGARHYDATLGRWFVVDPLAEKMSAWSPYAYCFNNPIGLIDEEGKSPLKIAKALYNVGKRAYKTYKKSGNLNFKKIFKDEALNIVDNVNTLLDGEASTFDKVIAGVDLLTGFGGEVSDGAKLMGIVDDATDLKKIYQTPEKLSEGLEYAIDINNLDHFFNKAQHGFDTLVKEMGDRKNVATAVFESLSKFDDLLDTDVFVKRVMVNNTEIEVRGVVHDGVIKIGTMYVPMNR